MQDLEKTSVKRVVGTGLDSDAKSSIKGYFESRFLNQQDLLKEVYPGVSEVVKTAAELEIINLANVYTNDLLRGMELPELNIPNENIHLVDEDADVESAARYYPKQQAIVARRQITNIGTANIIFHEMIHFKSYNAQQYIPQINQVIDYRVGLTSTSRKGPFTFLGILNEAATEELAREFVLRYKNNPLFKQELEDIERERKKMAGHYQYDGVPYAEKDDDVLLIPGLYKREDGKFDIGYGGFGYDSERKSFNLLVKKLFYYNPEKFKTEKQVLNMFFKGMMTGRIYTLGKIIDETFGVGAFRAIGVARNKEEFDKVIKDL